MRPNVPRLLLATALTLHVGAAWADAPPMHLGTVEVEGEREAGTRAAEADSTSFVTVIEVGEASARRASVADLIEREAGVRVRSKGGLGAFSSVSIRGSSGSEVAVFLDGVPLNRAASGAVDLSQLPVDDLERVEIYRGMPPPELGGQALGGAINLVTRKGRHGDGWQVTAGGGSFAARQAGLRYGFGDRRFHGDAGLAYRGARGDFPYYDNNGTLLNTADDHVGIRRNDGFDQGAVDVSFGGASGRTEGELGVHAFLKHQGVPARGFAEPPSSKPMTATLDTGRTLLAGSVTRRFDRVDLRLGGHFLFERLAFTNLDGDPVGSFLRAVRADSQTLAGGVDARLAVAASRYDLPTLYLSLDGERYQPRDLLRPEQSPAPSRRLRGALVLYDEVRLFADRLALSPALRLEGSLNALSPALGTLAQQAQGATTKFGFVAPQLGVRVQATRWLSFKGSVGRYLRMPTTLELFGDGAFFLPRPALRPETSVAGDAGLVLDGQHAWVSGGLEADFFGRQVADFIGVIPSGNGVSAANLGAQRFLGAEARGRLWLGRNLGVRVGYTFVHAVSGGQGSGNATAGKALPGVPEHKLDLHAELRGGPFALYYEVHYTSAVWLNPQNLAGSAIPARALHTLGCRMGLFERWPLTVSVEVTNLADLRVLQLPLAGAASDGRTVPIPLSDYYDYPLPGRSVYVTLAWKL